MNVLVLGGTGSIGGAIVQVLIERGHKVLALGRSSEARQLLREAGATPIEGDLRDPASWIDIVKRVDAVIHAAAVWGDEMGEIDGRFVEALLGTLRQDDSSKAFIYTGGCWLYGETGDIVATEKSPLNPPPSFGSSIPAIRAVLSASCIRGMVIHPAMVYERNGGVFEHIFTDAGQLGHVRVIGGENVRWPLVHRMDLAQLYALMLEQGKRGDVYNAAAVHGLPIGKITRAIASGLGIHTAPVVIDAESAKSEFGDWAEGFAIDQQMSGQKAIDQLGWAPKHTDVIVDVT